MSLSTRSGIYEHSRTDKLSSFPIWTAIAYNGHDNKKEEANHVAAIDQHFLSVTHSSWAFLVVLFLVSYFLLKTQKTKAATIVQMILRLFYLIMIISGIGMLIGYGFPVQYTLKGVLAIVLIGSIEGLLGKTKKGTIGTKAPAYWGVIIALLLLVILMGFNVIRF